MHVLEKAIRIFAPHSCVGCGVENDVLLCQGCQQTVVTVPSRCYRCKAVTNEYKVCRQCARSTPLRQVIVYAQYKDLAKQLVARTKYERAQSGGTEIARLLAQHALLLPSQAVITHVPTASSRVRTRGYDQAKLIARELSRATGLPEQTIMFRRGQAHQVGASRTERLRQLQDAFYIPDRIDIRGKHVVIVDDVVTTGATIETAARALKKAGAKRVSAVVFAQA